MKNLESYSPEAVPDHPTAAAVELEQNVDLTSLKDLEQTLKKARQEQGQDTATAPEGSPEQGKWPEKMKEIVSSFGESIKSAFDFLVVKPVSWLKEQAKKHPIITTVIVLGALGAAGYWYLSAPLQYGLEAIPSAGSAVVGEVLEKVLEIDPTRVGEWLPTQ